MPALLSCPILVLNQAYRMHAYRIAIGGPTSVVGCGAARPGLIAALAAISSPAKCIPNRPELPPEHGRQSQTRHHARDRRRARPQARRVPAAAEDPRPRALADRARHLLGDVERALLLQIEPRLAQDAAHQGPAGDPGPRRERRRGRPRRRRLPSSSRWRATTTPPTSSPTRAPPPASAASCATCSPWARARSPT